MQCSSTPISRPVHSPGLALRRTVLSLVVGVLAWSHHAQESADLPPVPPTRSATLSDARGDTALSMLDLPAGPMLALAPVAGRLGVSVEIGPLGARHSLKVRQKTILVGPDAASMAVMGETGEEQLVTLSQPPRRALEGLHVPLDFLERAFGDGLGVSFQWDAIEARLTIEARDERTLRAQLLQVRQGPVTTVEITFSEKPRYRVDRRPDGLDIQLVGDRLAMLEPFERDTQDTLVTEIEVEASRVRIFLAEDAAAAEPRLLGSPPRLVVEVFRRRVGRTTPVEDDPLTADRPAVGAGQLRTIVLDPGHGGSETGAISADGVAEKDLTLWFARTLARQLERRLPVRVLLTRTADTDLPLDSRTAFANQHKADLFISLHLNSWFGQGAHGAETYFLSRSATDQRAADAAAFENQDTPEPAGDPDLGLELILWDLAQTYHLEESQRFANLVQEELNASLGLTDRGVKQAPFRVLVGASMPSVVVELGFLSNPEEASRLQDPAYRGELVDALVRATTRFKMQLDATDPEATPGAEP